MALRYTRGWESPTPGKALNTFDRFACWVSTHVSRAPFFVACVALVLLWLVQGVIRVATGDLAAFADQTYQLEINTTTTIVTFLMVAILQNSQARNEKAMNEKLNAIADFLADLADSTAGHEMDQHVSELRRAVGLEEEVGA